VTPEAAISTLLSLAASYGAELSFGTAAASWSASSTGVRVTTETDEVLEADRLVIAPGGWAPGLFDLPLHVERRVQHYWRSPGPGFTIGEFPVWIWEDATATILYGMPEFGPDRLLKAAFHDARDPADASMGAAPPAPGEELPVRSWLRSRIPALSEAAYVEGKQCLYTLTPDENFVLGPHPSSERVVVACGFSGHGFKFVPVIGEILADLAVSGVSAFDLSIFSPTRF
jgi:sarcosine oxidase